jgi:gas vesicle protein
MSDKDNASGIVIGLFVGAVVGMAVGFLYAPKSGKETRALVREKALKAKDTAEDIIEEAKERAKRIIADARGKAAEIREEGKESES